MSSPNFQFGTEKIIYIYVYMYIYIHIHTHTHIYIHTHYMRKNRKATVMKC